MDVTILSILLRPIHVLLPVLEVFFCGGFFSPSLLYEQLLGYHSMKQASTGLVSCCNSSFLGMLHVCYVLPSTSFSLYLVSLSFFNSHPSNRVFFTPYELEIESVSSALACSWSKDEVIKCSSCLVFKWHSYTKPLRIRPHFDHFNTKLVLSSDPHCVTSLSRAALEV